MKTLNFLGRYVTAIWLIPGAPIFHRHEVDELDGQCRTSTALFVRLFPFRLALGFGRWRWTGMTEAQMFKKHFQARNIDLHDEDGNLDPRYAQAARETIARNAKDLDDEWQILQAVGLEQ